jgi:hypothetical protein
MYSDFMRNTSFGVTGGRGGVGVGVGVGGAEDNYRSEDTCRVVVGGVGERAWGIRMYNMLAGLVFP